MSNNITQVYSMNKITIVLFFLLSAVALYSKTTCFTDTQILPKYIFTLIIGGIMGIVFSIMFITKRKIIWNFNIISKIFTILCSIEAGMGILQYCNIFAPSSLFYKVAGSFDNPAGFAGCLCAGLPFSLYLSSKSRKMKQNISWKLLFLFILIGIILSESRAGYISLIIILAVYLVHRHRIRISSNKKMAIFLFITLVSSVFILSPILYYIKKDSVDGRLLIWQCSLEMIKDKPIAGHGIGAFNQHYMEYQAAFLEQHPDNRFAVLADNVKHPFNEYLSIGVQFGIIGWISLSIIIIFLIYCYKRYPSPEGYICLLALLSIGVFSFFSYPFTYPFVWIITFVCVVLLIKRSYSPPLFIQKRIVQKGIGISFLIISILELYTVGTRTKAEIEWKQTVYLGMFGKTNEALNRYDKLMDFLDKDPYFLYNYAVRLYLNGQYEKSLIVAKLCRRYWADYDLELIHAKAYIGIKQYEKAKEHLTKAAAMCPARFVPHYILQKVYHSQGDILTANKLAQAILRKRVKIDSKTIQRIKKEMKEYCLNNL